MLEILQEETIGEMVRKSTIPKVSEKNRLDTGTSSHQVYTRDLFTLPQSPRLGCGIMEMTDTTFDWTLQYDEIDYIIQGSLTVIQDGKATTALAGEVMLIPKGSDIQFSVSGHARFLYVTYPADWQNTNPKM
ncbi:MAG: cupin domain-containing protein [Eubacteriales bacterium]